MQPAKLNLPILRKGVTYEHELVWLQPDKITPVVLTDMTFKLQVRQEPESDTVLLECSTANGRLIITPLEGKINILITDEVTDTIPGEGGVYDLKVYYPSGKEDYICEGRWPFKQGVTRDV